MQKSNSPKVFISYSWDSKEHKERVLTLANHLISDDIDCRLDQYEQAPPEGWSRWMLKQIEESDFTLMVCTETYRRRTELKEEPGKGLGGIWEGGIITDIIYNQSTLNPNFIPVLFSIEDKQYIPRVLGSVMFYNVGTKQGYEELYRRLTDQPPIKKPPLGNQKF